MFVCLFFHFCYFFVSWFIYLFVIKEFVTAIPSVLKFKKNKVYHRICTYSLLMFTNKIILKQLKGSAWIWFPPLEAYSTTPKIKLWHFDTNAGCSLWRDVNHLNMWAFVYSSLCRSCFMKLPKQAIDAKLGGVEPIGVRSVECGIMMW